MNTYVSIPNTESSSADQENRTSEVFETASCVKEAELPWGGGGGVRVIDALDSQSPWRNKEGWVLHFLLLLLL